MFTLLPSSGEKCVPWNVLFWYSFISFGFVWLCFLWKMHMLLCIYFREGKVRETGTLSLEGPHSTVTGWPVLSPPQIRFALVLERSGSSRRLKLLSTDFIEGFKQSLRFLGQRCESFEWSITPWTPFGSLWEANTRPGGKAWFLISSIICGAVWTPWGTSWTL